MPRPQRKNRFIQTDEQPVSSVTSSDNSLTEESNIDAYLNPVENLSTDFTEKDAEIEILNETNKSLIEDKKSIESDNKDLLAKMEILIKENEELKKSTSKAEVDQLIQDNIKFSKENDELILRNSELEFEIARLTETLKHIQKKIDNGLHTYTKPGYNSVGGYVPATNGYQDWK